MEGEIEKSRDLFIELRYQRGRGPGAHNRMAGRESRRKERQNRRGHIQRQFQSNHRGDMPGGYEGHREKRFDRRVHHRGNKGLQPRSPEAVENENERAFLRTRNHQGTFREEASFDVGTEKLRM